MKPNQQWGSSYEQRFAGARGIRMNSAGGKRTLEGYAATFSARSEDLGGWRERVARGAFSRAIRSGQDVRHLVNHDPSRVLGRTRAGTLTLVEDDTGLRFRVDLPATTYAADIAESVSRGDVSQCSFGFACVRDEWAQESDDKGAPLMVRTLHDVDLFDTSVVTYPAYPGTSAEVVDQRALHRSLFPGTGQVPARIQERMKATVVLSVEERIERVHWKLWADAMDASVRWLQ